MKKTIVALGAAGAMAAATLAPQPVKADPISAWWLLPAFLGGVVVGSATNYPAYAGPRAYYDPGPAYYAGPRAHYVPGPTYHRAPRASVAGSFAYAGSIDRGCRLEQRPALFGGWRNVEICN